jgi:hypothetical protein
MNAIADRLFLRFPILTRACIRQEDDGVEALPPFLGIFMAAMDYAAGSGPLCFLLPRRGDMARLATVVYGLYRFAVSQAELVRQYGEINFKPGELVRIHPSRHVFRYLGFDPRLPDYIRLRPPNAGDWDSWSIKAARFVPRLERTTLTRPIGRMNTPIHDPEVTPLDRLLGTSMFGNQGLFRNEVILLDSLTGCQQFVESVTLQPTEHHGTFTPLKSLVPFGHLSVPSNGRNSWFSKWDQRNPTGEPLVAVTPSPETLAAYCVDAPMRSKVVVVNGLARVRDLQSFDDIQQTQRMILFADEKDGEAIRAIRDRGCQFWDLSRDEIETAQNHPPEFGGMVGKLRVWARNREQLTLDAECSDNRALDDVCVRLESLRRIINDEEQGPATKLVARMWGFLNETAAGHQPPSGEERTRRISQLADFTRDLRLSRAWLKPEAERALADSASELGTLLSDTLDYGASKRAALDRVVAQCPTGSTLVVLVRNERQALDSERYLRTHIKSGRVKVCTPKGLIGDCVYDRIVCLSWPTAETLEDLANSMITSRITLLGYAFERRWLHQMLVRRQGRPQRYQIGPDQKAAIMDGDAYDGTSANVAWPPEGPLPPLAVDDIWGLEQRLRSARKGSAGIPTQASETMLARYVSFVGASYAFLTETHRVVVVTGLLSSGGQTKQRLPEQMIESLKRGDFVVFPESGDRELIQEKADQLLGSVAQKFRKTARLWKDALKSSTLTPSVFLKEARELGRPRHLMTIRKWFGDTYQIGPGTGNEELSEDLELIALVTGYEPLKLQIPNVIEAVKALRGAHLSAGARLRDVLIDRLPEVIGRVEEEGSIVDLGELGSAWIMQIESVAAAAELRGRGEVNRLMWDRAGVDVRS